MTERNTRDNTRDLGALRRQVEAYRRTDDERGLAVALGELGVQLAAKGGAAGGEEDRSAAQRHLVEALSLFERVGDHGGAALTRLNLGNLASDAGQWAEALAFYNSAGPLFERLGDLPRLGLLYRNIGLLHRRQHHPAEAIAAYAQAAALHERTGDEVGTASALYHLAHLHAARGEPAEAIRAMERVVVVDLAHGFPKYAENMATLKRWRTEAGFSR